METGHENSKVLKIGGSPGFDFMNTNYVLGSRIEVLDSPQALLNSMVEVELLTKDDLKAIRARFSASDLTRLLTDGMEMRNRLRAVLFAFTEKGAQAIAKEDLRYLNNILRRGGSHLQVEIQGKEHLYLAPAHEWNNVEEVLALVVESVLRTLTMVKPELIKKCAYEPCHLYFVDETKAHRRHYCSQAICGNRVKQAAFRERRKRGE